MGVAERLLQREVAPLGVRTTFTADDPRLLAAAVAACPDSPPQFHEPGNAIEIRLEAANIPSFDLSCRIEVEGSRIAVTGADFRGYADAETKSGVCQVPLRLMLEPEAFSAELLDPILLFLLARSGRTPIHAAGIMIGDCALLLAGPSGSGKSTLAQAAVERGLRILSDDTVYVQLRPAFRAWGLPRPVHLLPNEAPPGDYPQRHRAGRIKSAVPLPPAASAPVADQARLVLLEPGGGPALSVIPGEEAQAALGRLEPGFDLLPEKSAVAVRMLTADGAWRLTLGRDPRAAIGLLVDQFAGAGE